MSNSGKLLMERLLMFFHALSVAYIVLNVVGLTGWLWHIS